MTVLRVAVPLDSCGCAFGSGFIHILMVKAQLPSRLERSLWFSLSFDISLIFFIISCGFGCPVGAAGWAALRAESVAGDVAGLCANEEVATKVAKRIVINDMNVFMGGILPVTCLRVKLPLTSDFGVTSRRGREDGWQMSEIQRTKEKLPGGESLLGNKKPHGSVETVRLLFVMSPG